MYAKMPPETVSTAPHDLIVAYTGSKTPAKLNTVCETTVPHCHEAQSRIPANLGTLSAILAAIEQTTLLVISNHYSRRSFGND
jgi:hypothetical protein